MAYTGKFIDRSPSLRPAGLLSFRKEEDVAGCLVHEVTEVEAQPFVCKTSPLVYKLPPLKNNFYKGWFTEVRECVQPEVDQSVCTLLTREFQDTVYDSYWKKSLGRVADQTPMLPAGMDPQKVCFGKATPRPVSLGELVNPPKSYVDVMEESRVGHQMYRETHNDYDPGEQTRRGYAAPFDQNQVCGINTPCDPLGGCTKKVMTYDINDKILVSKILTDYRKRSRPLIGKVLAPNNNIDCVPEGHAFGKLNKRGMYGVGELLKDSPPSLDKIDLYDQLSHINVLREQIAKRQPPFPHRDFIDVFHQIDNKNTGCISLDTAYEILADFQVHPEKPLFEDLLMRFGILSKARTVVAYEKMGDLLNVNVMFPIITKLKDIPKEFLNFETTNQLAQLYHCSEDPINTKDIPRAGLPTGVHVSMEGVVSPSIFTTYGLQPIDFFISRSPEYLRILFGRIGCEMDDNAFNKVWIAAKDKHGCVCVQSFLAALKACK